MNSSGSGKYESDNIILKFICKYKFLNTWHQYIIGEEKGNSVSSVGELIIFLKYIKLKLSHSLHYIPKNKDNSDDIKANIYFNC
jgi:hypothetical protein